MTALDLYSLVKVCMTFSTNNELFYWGNVETVNKTILIKDITY
jgi:hypothetical protein